MKTKISGVITALGFGLLSGSLPANEPNTADVVTATPVVTVTALTGEQAERIAALREAQRQESAQLEADYSELIQSVMQGRDRKQS